MCVIRTLNIYSPSDFQINNTVIKLYIRFQNIFILQLKSSPLTSIYLFPTAPVPHHSTSPYRTCSPLHLPPTAPVPTDRTCPPQHLPSTGTCSQGHLLSHHTCPPLHLPLTAPTPHRTCPPLHLPPNPRCPPATLCFHEFDFFRFHIGGRS